MSAGFQALLIYIILTAIYYLWYWAIRYRLRKRLIWNFLLFLNMIFGVFLVIPIAQVVLQSFNVSNSLMNLCLSIMAIAIVLHHLSLLLLSRKKNNSNFLEFIHIPLSHVLLGVPYVLIALMGALMFSPQITTSFDMAIYIIWFLETAVIGLSITLVGLGIIKVNKKW